MRWRAGFGIFSLMIVGAACSSAAPAGREPLITRDARGEQRLRMMRHQETVANPKAAPQAKIEAHFQLGHELMGTPDGEELAKKHLVEVTTLWSRHQRQLSEPARRHALGFVTRSYFYQGELASQSLRQLGPSSAAPSHPHYNKATRAFSDAFNRYRYASRHAQEAKAQRWFVAAELKQGEVLEQLVRVTSQYSDKSPRQVRSQHRRMLHQASAHYKRAVMTQLDEGDVEGQRWRSEAQARLCALELASCAK